MRLCLVVRYRFTQCFSVSARKAYEWCTDFAPSDPALMGDESATRHVMRLTDATVILTDTFRTSKSIIEKQKLVQLYPEQLRWVSTHLTGPNKYSQFLYEISAEDDDSSRLTFTALHLEHTENLSADGVKQLAAKLRKEDSALWKRFANAMAKELGKIEG